MRKVRIFKIISFSIFLFLVFNLFADFSSYDVIVTDFDFVHQNFDLFSVIYNWEYIVIDETGECNYTIDDYTWLMKIAGKCKVFVSSSDLIISKNLNRLHCIHSLLFSTELNNSHHWVSSLFENLNRKKRNLLLGYFREFRLKRYQGRIDDDLPLIDQDVSKILFIF